MEKRSDSFVVTHSHAPDPDPAKVKATLDLWRRALAERILVGEPIEGPIARITLDPNGRPRRAGRSRKVSGDSASK